MVFVDKSMAGHLLRLRLAVGYLGEKPQHSWWTTEFFGRSSLSFLGPVFPRTEGLAQYHGVIEAGRLHHDERLSAGSYHLFRLPEEVEQDIHGLLRTWIAEDAHGWRPNSREDATAVLHRWADCEQAAREGPVRIGETGDLGTEHSVAKLSSYYRAAFLAGVQTVPYLGQG